MYFSGLRSTHQQWGTYWDIGNRPGPHHAFHAYFRVESEAGWTQSCRHRRKLGVSGPRSDPTIAASVVGSSAVCRRGPQFLYSQGPSSEPIIRPIIYTARNQAIAQSSCRSTVLYTSLFSSIQFTDKNHTDVTLTKYSEQNAKHIHHLEMSSAAFYQFSRFVQCQCCGLWY